MITCILPRAYSEIRLGGGSHFLTENNILRRYRVKILPHCLGKYLFSENRKSKNTIQILFRSKIQFYRYKLMVEFGNS